MCALYLRPSPQPSNKLHRLHFVLSSYPYDLAMARQQVPTPSESSYSSSGYPFPATGENGRNPDSDSDSDIFAPRTPRTLSPSPSRRRRSDSPDFRTYGWIAQEMRRQNYTPAASVAGGGAGSAMAPWSWRRSMVALGALGFVVAVGLSLCSRGDTTVAEPSAADFPMLMSMQMRMSAMVENVAGGITTSYGLKHSEMKVRQLSTVVGTSKLGCRYVFARTAPTISG